MTHAHFIGKDAKLPVATSCVGKSNVSIGTGGNPFIWWASVSHPIAPCFVDYAAQGEAKNKQITMHVPPLSPHEYTHTHTHMHTHARTHARTHAHTHTHTHTYTHTHTHTTTTHTTQSSGIIIIVTLGATCLYCCCFACVCSTLFSRIVTYIAIAGIILSLLCFCVLLAWMGVGTYMATLVVNVEGQTCINFFILLALFFVYLAALIVFCAVSCVWKLHDLAVNRTKDKPAV